MALTITPGSPHLTIVALARKLILQAFETMHSGLNNQWEKNYNASMTFKTILKT
jgi:hypothetical protein